MLNLPDVLKYTINHGQSTPQTFYIPSILSPNNCSNNCPLLTAEECSYAGLLQEWKQIQLCVNLLIVFFCCFFKKRACPANYYFTLYLQFTPFHKLMQIQTHPSGRNVFLDNLQSHWSGKVIKRILISHQHLWLVYSFQTITRESLNCEPHSAVVLTPVGCFPSVLLQFKPSHYLLSNHWQVYSSYTCTPRPYSQGTNSSLRGIFFCFTP